MPLSPRLMFVPMTFECPTCGHPVVKNGTWFSSVGHFTCEGCHGQVTLTYRDKLALFAKHTPASD
jgi:transposase-like protein